MARRVLNLAAAAALCLGPLAGACKHDRAAPPTPAPAPPDSASENARQLRFDSELKRSQARWLEKPDLGHCAEIVHEKPDIELCTVAASALAAVEQLDPAATPDTALPRLATASLAIERLMERTRYLSMEDLGRPRLDGDAGPATPGASARAAAAVATPAASMEPLKLQRALHGLLREHTSLKLSDSPLSLLVQNSARLERDVLRHLAAYLEYAPLPVRRSAFDTVQRLQAEHPQWPALSHLLREASVLETDAALKQNLTELWSMGLHRGKNNDQPTGSK